MEREYIFHHTAYGFIVFLTGTIALLIISIFFALHFSISRLLNYTIFSLLASAVIFLSFKVDTWAMARKKKFQ
jgi:hypothetical protein